MSNSQKVLKNSLFLYIRMLLLMAVGLYTTRVILEALGIEDLGIYNIVGSLVMMFDFISSGLTGATQRFLNIGIGKKDNQLTNKYFSQSFFLHLTFSIIVILLLETIGLWFVYNKLVIPESRIEAAILVFHYSTISLGIRIIKICFESDIIANQKMSIYAYLSIFEALAKLLICYAIIKINYDQLILYGLLLLLLNLTITLINIIYCITKYPETRIKWYKDKFLYKELLSFIGLNSFGVIAWAIGKQGINIIINIFFGPIVNGAKGIASNLERVVIQFSSNIELAVRPQITQLYAQNKINEMIDLGMTSTKFIYYIMLIVAIPLLFQTESFLNLWLNENPPFTVGFVRIMIIEALIYCIGSNFYNVTMATGKIKRVQIIGRIITLSALPLSYIFIRIYNNEYIPSFILAITSMIYSYFIILDANNKLRFGMILFFKKVLLPIIIVSAISILGCFYITKCINIELTLFFNFIFKTIILCIYTFIIIVALGCNYNERLYILHIIKRKIK